MIIKLDTGYSYNLASSDEVKKLKQNIYNMTNRNQTKRILGVYNQIKQYEDYKGEEASSIQARELCKFLIPKLKAFFTSEQILPPTQNNTNDTRVEVVKMEQATAPNPKETLAPLTTREAEVNQKIEQVTTNVEKGQDSFLQFSFNLLFDLDNFKSEKEYVAWYIAIALNLYMHNASHKPMPGYGKAQKLEEDHPLFYFRSQANHPHRSMSDKIIKTKDDVRPKSVFPLDPIFLKHLATILLPEDEDTESNEGKKLTEKRKKLAKNLKTIDPRRGFPKEDQKIPDYFSLFLAHAGLRTNNLTGIVNGLEDVAASENNTLGVSALKKKFKELKDILPKSIPKNIERLDEATITAYIKTIQERFIRLKKQSDEFKPCDHLQGRMQAHRVANNQYICAEATEVLAKLDKGHPSLLTVKPNGMGCILISIDQKKFGPLIAKGKKYLDEVTYAIVGFFCGLLNYHAKLKGLSIRVDIRQSFGFLRPTLTDADTLELRLSLGLEPAIFNQIVIDSIADLHSVLNAEIDFPEKFPEMKSEKKRWKSAFEAQYYLEQNSNKIDNESHAAKAFKQYLAEFGVDNVTKVANPETICKVENKSKILLQASYDTTPLFYLLQNLLKYALNFAASFEAYKETSELAVFGHSYWHSLLKLYGHCQDAQTLLTNLNKYEVSKAYQEANCHIENILEYLIALDSLYQIQAKIQGKELNRKTILEATEKNHAVASFGLDEKQVNVYFTNNGQQAVVSSLLAMDNELYLSKIHNEQGDQNIYNFNKTYYEMDLFFNDVGNLKNTLKTKATIALIDITQLNELNFDDFPNLQALIIDTTRDPSLNNEDLKMTVARARKLGKWVVLASSCLKHDELGLDKYSAGKIMTLAPDNQKPLFLETIEILEETDCQIHPAVASYLQMVNEICRDKPLPEKLEPQLTAAAKGGLRHYGMLSKNVAAKKPLESDVSPIANQYLQYIS